MLTSAAIDALPAGRELDALVAEKVMGYEVKPLSAWPDKYPSREDRSKLVRSVWMVRDAMNPICFIEGNPRSPKVGDSDGHWSPCDIPSYSTSIAAAWEVVEKLTKIFGLTMTRLPNDDSWEISIYRLNEDGDYMATADDIVSAATAPLAICRAALKAVSA